MIAGETRPLPALCLHDQISLQAGRTPTAIAVEHGAESICYSELEDRSNRLAIVLGRRGVGRDDLVFLSASASIPTMLAMIAVLKCGAAYVPVDPAYPAERKRAISTQVSAALALVNDVEGAVAFGCPTSALEPLLDEAGALPNAPAPPPGRLDSLAYLIFTSGSTGAPKGVMTHHLGIANLVGAMSAAWPIGPRSRVLQFASLGFDASVPEWAGPLTTGGTVVLKPGPGLLLGDDLANFIRDNRITLIKLPASSLRLVPSRDLPSLETVVTAGEACTEELVRSWAPGRRFFNCYGPTEVSIGSTMARLEADGRPVTIGRPNPNLSALVLDEDLSPAAPGRLGELFIAGIGLSWGYLGRPGLTAERFLPNPEGPPGSRMYRTGDLVRLLPDGELSFAGRADDQVKIRGYRVELGEVEAELLRIEGVRQASVRVTGESLVAYVSPDRGLPPGDRLRGALAGRLPHYMVPGIFVFLPELPLNAHGKVDVSSLPPPPEPATETVELSASDAVGDQVAAAWKEAIGARALADHSHFFDLGGHSLAATRVVARLNKALGVALEVRALFDSPVFGDFVRRYEEALDRQGDLHTGVI